MPRETDCEEVGDVDQRKSSKPRGKVEGSSRRPRAVG